MYDISFDYVDSGIIEIHQQAELSAEQGIWVNIEKDGDGYWYALKADDKPTPYTLPYGNGDYTIIIAQRKPINPVTGNNAQILEQTTVTLDMDNPDNVFLANAGLLRWNNNMECIKYAAELGDLESIRKFMRSLRYDKNSSIKDIETTYLTGTGMCTEFATLFVCMLRSQNIPAKLIYGYVGTEYHAWAEVWNGVAWETIDITTEIRHGQGKKHHLPYVPKHVF